MDVVHFQTVSLEHTGTIKAGWQNSMVSLQLASLAVEPTSGRVGGRVDGRLVSGEGQQLDAGSCLRNPRFDVTNGCLPPARFEDKCGRKFAQEWQSSYNRGPEERPS